MGRWGAALAVALVVLATGCGHAKKPAAKQPSGPGLAMEHRLKAHGYTVSGDLNKPRGEPYDQAFSVDRIDWTTPASFSAFVYIFGSADQAAAHRVRTVGLTGVFPSANKSRLVGAHLYVATLVGGEGVSQCRMSNGRVHCPPGPNISNAAFEKVIAVAEGR
jgi:hypothetical protein